MTAIVGIRCSDGVVIGANSSPTFGDCRLQTIEQPMRKVDFTEDKVMVAGTGAVGLGQRLIRLVRMAYRQNLFAGDDHIEVSKALSRAAIDDFASTHAKAGQYGALVGFSLGGRPRLCEFALADFQPEFKDKRIWYVSKGSGQPITDPFLALMRSVFWKSRPPTVQDGKFAVTWALEHAVEVNPGGINGPIQVAPLERPDVWVRLECPIPR